MGILGNMQLLSSCSRVYVSEWVLWLWRKPTVYHYGRCAMLKLIFLAPKFRQRRVQKRAKKVKKMKNCVLQKKLFYFCVLTSWTKFWDFSEDFSSPVKVRNFGNFVVYSWYATIPVFQFLIPTFTSAWEIISNRKSSSHLEWYFSECEI